MKNFTLKMFSLLFLGFVGVSVSAQEWNMSTASFSGLGTLTATTTVEGLTITASSDASVVVDANNKSLDGMNFTSRLKLGGTGTFGTDGKPIARVLTFAVTGNTTITVMGMSSSSTADRQFNIAAGKKDSIIGTFTALGASISKGVYTYTGKATTIYMFSPSSGVNIYYIKSAPLTTEAQIQKVQELNVYPNPASGKVYINSPETSMVGIFSITGQMVKQQQLISSQNCVDISNLHTGVYFVKTMGNNSRSQKLIIR